MSREVKHYALWKLTVSPLVWSVHFILCYAAVAIWCAKFGRSANLYWMRIFILVVTILSLVVVLFQMIKSYREHKQGSSELPHAEATPEDRDRFLGFANFLISALSALAILFVAFNAVIFRSCQ